MAPGGRPRIPGPGLAHRKLEVARRARLARRGGARMKRAAPMLETAHRRDVIELHDFHGRWLPRLLKRWGIVARIERSAMRERRSIFALHRSVDRDIRST